MNIVKVHATCNSPWEEKSLKNVKSKWTCFNKINVQVTCDSTYSIGKEVTSMNVFLFSYTFIIFNGFWNGCGFNWKEMPLNKWNWVRAEQTLSIFVFPQSSKSKRSIVAPVSAQIYMHTFIEYWFIWLVLFLTGFRYCLVINLLKIVTNQNGDSVMNF